MPEIRDGANSCHLTLSDSDTSGYFGTTKLNQMSVFGDVSYADDGAYEGADFFEVGDQKEMWILQHATQASIVRVN